MGNDLDKEGDKLYTEQKNILLGRQLSNSELYDRSILLLSTAALGISISFITNIVTLAQAQFKQLLVASWCLFGLSVIMTIISFQTSQRAIKTQLEYAWKYYIEGSKEHLNKKIKCAVATEWLNFLSGCSFIIAIISTIIFVSINISGQPLTMTDNKTDFLTEGSPSVEMHLML